MSPRGETVVRTFSQTELTDDQRAAVQELCSRETYCDVVDYPGIWLFAYALASLVHDTATPTVEQAWAFYDDAETNHQGQDAGPPPWRMAKLPESGNYDAVVIINDRMFGAEVGEGYIELALISDATDWLTEVRREAAVSALRAAVQAWPVMTRDMVSRGYVRDWLARTADALEEDGAVSR